ncbi:hypothetical protein GGS23DRAFT_190514 [Durotheca rogersii]|uniref:uncharacterized protein n=1 Tax=Durotheca rogersii TaxID=419775 RepID=UPI00221F699B|nr:uncharacterized protein GGS23DRAFT_190514 [Durotheca rogersii]KAI5867708.1 hypothetical protein GGS23DRAFT_190514 [Durotheca rogersii]
MSSHARGQIPPGLPVQSCKTSEPHSIVVEPTPENQKAYNEIRRAHERASLQTHLASQQSLRLPSTAPSVASAAPSHSDEPGGPCAHEAMATGTNRSKKPRGKRKGPLEAQTRLRTAVKRKLKLACPHHRAKKTTCDCHDFSLLEKGYEATFHQLSAIRDRPRFPSDVTQRALMEPTLNQETFGIGGGAVAPPHIDTTANDFGDMSRSLGDDCEGVVRPSLRNMLTRFNLDSPHFSSDILHPPVQPYYPGNNLGSSQSPESYTQYGLLEIGSQMQQYPLRWQCEYKGPVDSASETSPTGCSWTGPIWELPHHFRAKHCQFDAASPPVRVVCEICGAQTQCESDLSTSFSCDNTGCSSTSARRWYYGSTGAESVTESVPTFTQSSESEAGNSRNVRPEGGGNHSWLGGGGLNGGRSSFSFAGSFREFSNHYRDDSDTSSDSSSDIRLSGPPDSRRHAHTPGRRAEERPSGVGANVPYAITQPKAGPYRLCADMLSHINLKLPINHLLPLMLSLLAAFFRERRYAAGLRSPSLSEKNADAGADACCWRPLGLLILGFMATETGTRRGPLTRTAKGLAHA